MTKIVRHSIPYRLHILYQHLPLQQWRQRQSRHIGPRPAWYQKVARIACFPFVYELVRIGKRENNRYSTVTYMASQRLAEKSRWTAWSFISAELVKYELIICPVWVVLSEVHVNASFSKCRNYGCATCQETLAAWTWCSCSSDNQQGWRIELISQTCRSPQAQSKPRVSPWWWTLVAIAAYTFS